MMVLNRAVLTVDETAARWVVTTVLNMVAKTVALMVEKTVALMEWMLAASSAAYLVDQKVDARVA